MNTQAKMTQAFTIVNKFSHRRLYAERTNKAHWEADFGAAPQSSPINMNQWWHIEERVDTSTNSSSMIEHEASARGAKYVLTNADSGRRVYAQA